jgi:hypothetical protein
LPLREWAVDLAEVFATVALWLLALAGVLLEVCETALDAPKSSKGDNANTANLNIMLLQTTSLSV